MPGKVFTSNQAESLSPKSLPSVITAGPGGRGWGSGAWTRGKMPRIPAAALPRARGRPHVVPLSVAPGLSNATAAQTRALQSGAASGKNSP